MNIKHEIEKIIKSCVGIEVKLIEPKDPQFGDYSTSIAFTLAKERSPSSAATPIKVAEEFVSRLKLPKELVGRVEIKEGYINLWLNQEFIQRSLNKILVEGKRFGSSNLGNNKRVLVEFVSANPTGPLVVANGRAAAIGDSLVRILNFIGYQANSEYYVDDCGRQIDLLEESIKARYDELRGKEAKIPEGGYPGEYIKEIAKQIKESNENNFREFGVKSIVELHRNTLQRFGVKFDNWVYESEIRKSGGPQKVIDCLTENGVTYKKEGALWLKIPGSTDKVLVKSNGEVTYRVPDIAYHLYKFNRGYELLIDLFGPDQSHVSELKTGLSICGFPVDILKIITVQWVTFTRGDKKVSMSKRKGEFITLDELLDEVGKDAARFFFLMRRCESHLDFDIELAKRESKENPVYYIQYAGARIASILRFATNNVMASEPNLSLLKELEEVLLMRKLIHFPEIVEHAGEELSPHYIPFYLLELASLFHNFYEKHRVVSDDVELTKARLTLVKAVRQVISNGLSLIGIETPEKM